MESVFIQCPFCFETFEFLIDSGGGESQELITDCEVCCHPIDLVVRWDEDEQKYSAQIERGSGF